VIDQQVTLGSLTLANPVMTASGTAGHGAELQPYVDLGRLGAHVVKSMSSYPWPGNPAPRLHPAGVGMVNAVGLQGDGIVHWIAHDLPALQRHGVNTVASIWGRSVDDYYDAAVALGELGPEVAAVEVNLSCPNLEGRRGIFAHDPELSSVVIAGVVARAGRPCWAKLSANTDRVVEVAEAVHAAGAEAVTLINTLLGMVLDPDDGRPVLGAGGGGYSGTPIHPVAVRTVFDVHAALPELPIVGVGGVSTGWHAAEMLLAGASAVQVGTATFADPRAPWRVLHDLLAWCAANDVHRVAELMAWCRRVDHTPASLRGLGHRGGLAGGGAAPG
jgi:dihydroorotate dehydrogenase (NAD+) catalytic subunit